MSEIAEICDNIIDSIYVQIDELTVKKEKITKTISLLYNLRKNINTQIDNYNFVINIIKKEYELKLSGDNKQKRK